MLFHYHHWTPYVEETENYYMKQGFTVHQRLGKYGGDFQAFNPPLAWDDFREKEILFRIIEMKKGNVNITFGYGKRVMFDHIGFLVSPDDHDSVCQRARKLEWDVKVGERRTFLQTPYGFSIELQTNMDVIAKEENPSTIRKMMLQTRKKGFEDDLSLLFSKNLDEIVTTLGENVKLEEVFVSNILTENSKTPNGFYMKRPSIR